MGYFCINLSHFTLILSFDSPFNIKDIVYLKTDTEQRPRIVTSILITEKEVLLELCSGSVTTKHYPFEITVEKDVLITTEN